MRRRLLVPFGTVVLASASAGGQTLSIDHQPVGCATAEKFARLEARFSPAEAVATARVVFQGQTTDWYSVAMKPEGAAFAGVLPKPKKGLKSFRYYIEVTGKSLETSRTPEHTAAVVDSASACKGRIMAGALGSASVILQGPAGVAALPAGFASTGVVAGSAAGSGSAAGAAGASAAGGGGGIGTTALVLGGVAVAGGAVAVGVSKGGSEDASSNTSGPPGFGSTGSIYDVFFRPNPPGIDISVCAGRPLNWGSQALSVDANGNFNMTWAPNEPNTVRISGQLTPTNFQATLACVNGAQSGAISATGSNNSYSGTYALGASSGQVSIAKQ